MIMGIDTKGRYQVIKARTPLAELDRYSTTLRSLSQGRGTFIQRVDNYEPVPTELQQKLARQFSAVDVVPA
jgi:elongation factor G